MENKFSLFVLALISGLMFAGSCLAKNDHYGRGNYYGNGNYSVNDSCSGSFWDDNCQQAIKERDYNSNRRQIPRYYDYGYSYGDNYGYDYTNNYIKPNQNNYYSGYNPGNNPGNKHH